MKIEDFEKKLKTTTSSYGGTYDIKVRSNKERITQEIFSEGRKNVPKQFGHNNSENDNVVIVIFKKSHPLTIFEANMLYSVWVRGKKPADYASYHKCPAGKEFIQNIDFIRAVKKD